MQVPAVSCEWKAMLHLVAEQLARHLDGLVDLLRARGAGGVLEADRVVGDARRRGCRAACSRRTPTSWAPAQPGGSSIMVTTTSCLRPASWMHWPEQIRFCTSLSASKLRIVVMPCFLNSSACSLMMSARLGLERDDVDAAGQGLQVGVRARRPCGTRPSRRRRSRCE